MAGERGVHRGLQAVTIAACAQGVVGRSEEGMIVVEDEDMVNFDTADMLSKVDGLVTIEFLLGDERCVEESVLRLNDLEDRRRKKDVEVWRKRPAQHLVDARIPVLLV